jgi:serine phosphatase RsbU (regulator of sigma subunit)
VRREKEIQRDAQLATRVQKALLTNAQPKSCLDVHTIYKPFSYVGGDLYFMDWRYHGQVLRGFIADATGHGLGTALNTASMHVLLREVNEMDLPLSEQMRWLNRRAGQYFDEGTFPAIGV